MLKVLERTQSSLLLQLGSEKRKDVQNCFKSQVLDIVPTRGTH